MRECGFYGIMQSVIDDADRKYKHFVVGNELKLAKLNNFCGHMNEFCSANIQDLRAIIYGYNPENMGVKIILVMDELEFGLDDERFYDVLYLADSFSIRACTDDEYEDCIELEIVAEGVWDLKGRYH